MRTIHIVDQQAYLPPDKVELVMLVLQGQLHEDFAPHWGIEAQVVYHTPTDDTPFDLLGKELIYLLDHSTQANLLGYHTTSADGRPRGFVFMEDTLKAGRGLAEVLGHELFEQLINPSGGLAVYIPDLPGSILPPPTAGWIAYECVDPVAGSTYRKDGMHLANFVLPAWFVPTATPGLNAFDYLGYLGAPLSCTPGGYMQYSRSPGEWKMFGAERAPANGYSRVERRLPGAF